MDHYRGGLRVEGHPNELTVDVADPLSASGWQSAPIPGLDLERGMAAAGPFRVSLHRAGSSLDGWSSLARWATDDDGETWALAGDGPFTAP